MAPSLASRGWDFSPHLWDGIVLELPLGVCICLCSAP